MLYFIGMRSKTMPRTNEDDVKLVPDIAAPPVAGTT